MAAVFNNMCQVAERHVEAIRVGLHSAKLFRFEHDSVKFDGDYTPEDLKTLARNFMMPSEFVYVDNPCDTVDGGVLLWDTVGNQVGFSTPRCFLVAVPLLHAGAVLKLPLGLNPYEATALSSIADMPPDATLLLSGVLNSFDVIDDFKINYDGKLDWSLSASKRKIVAQYSVLQGKEFAALRSALQRLALSWTAKAVELLLMHSRPSALMVEVEPKDFKPPRHDGRILRVHERATCHYMTPEEIKPLTNDPTWNGKERTREYPNAENASPFMSPAKWRGPDIWTALSDGKHYTVHLNV